MLFVLFIIMLVILGPSFVFGQIKEVKNSLIVPVTDRFGMTVAENRQPYFGEWEGSFGPVKFKIPLYFWLFFVGAVVLFNNMLKSLFLFVAVA